MNANKANKRNWAGIILVVLGAGFLLRNLGLVYLPPYFFSWKTLLIAIGVVALALGKRDGLIPLAIGAFFLLVQDIFHIHINFRDLWPVVLIIIGIALIIRHRRGSESREILTPSIDEVAIFSGLEKKVMSTEFMGGKTTSIFGGVDIDLRKAKLSEGNNIIDIFTLFGGSSFHLPPDWTVNISQLTVLFGGFSDQRILDTSKTDPKKVLHIKGLILFGGGEIKN